MSGLFMQTSLSFAFSLLRGERSNPGERSTSWLLGRRVGLLAMRTERRRRIVARGEEAAAFHGAALRLCVLALTEYIASPVVAPIANCVSQ